MTSDDALLEGALRVLFLTSDEELRQRLAAVAVAPVPGPRRRIVVTAALAVLAAAVLVVVALWRDGPAFWDRGPQCVELRSAAREPLDLQVGAVALRIDGGVCLDFGSGGPAITRREAMNRAQLTSFLAARAAVPMFTITVLSGTAFVEAQQQHDLRAGEVQVVQQPEPLPPPSPQDLAAVRALWPAVTATTDDAGERCSELAFRLRLQPALYDAVRTDLQRIVRDASTDDEVFARAVQLLVFDPDAGSFQLAASLVGGRRELDFEALLRLSERGLLDARRLLTQALGDAPDDDTDLYAVAAHLAGRAMPPAPRLRQVLTAALEREHGLEPVVLVRAMVAALGLQALGDGAPLRALWPDLDRAVEEALTNEALEDAAAMVAIAEWLTKNGVHAATGSLAYLRDDFLSQWSRRAIEQDLADAARIRARLAAIRSR